MSIFFGAEPTHTAIAYDKTGRRISFNEKLCVKNKLRTGLGNLNVGSRRVRQVRNQWKNDGIE